MAVGKYYNGFFLIVTLKVLESQVKPLFMFFRYQI